jgi:hypothetical protein
MVNLKIRKFCSRHFLYNVVHLFEIEGLFVSSYNLA